MLGAAFVGAAYRNIQKFEVIEVAASWVVASVDSQGNRFLVCDYSEATHARRRSAHLNGKLRAPGRSKTRADYLRIPPARPIH